MIISREPSDIGRKEVLSHSAFYSLMLGTLATWHDNTNMDYDQSQQWLNLQVQWVWPAALSKQTSTTHVYLPLHLWVLWMRALNMIFSFVVAPVFAIIVDPCVLVHVWLHGYPSLWGLMPLKGVWITSVLPQWLSLAPASQNGHQSSQSAVLCQWSNRETWGMFAHRFYSADLRHRAQPWPPVIVLQVTIEQQMADLD